MKTNLDTKKPSLSMSVIGCLLLAILLCGSPTPAAAQAPELFPEDSASERSLFLERIELVGTEKTSLETVLLYLPLQPGQPITQDELVAAVDDLVDGDLFAAVDYYTRPGHERGQIVLVLDVEEHGFDFRFAAGNTDLDGWYLVPAMVAWDNLFGQGERVDFQIRWGFRHAAFLATYARPRVGDGRSYWGTQIRAINTDRPYFSEGVEYRHEVRTAGLLSVYGRRFDTGWIAETGLNLEGVDTDESSHVHSHSDLSDGPDEIGGEDLPEAIRRSVGQDFRTIVHLDFQRDTRSERKRAGSPVSGHWARLKLLYAFQSSRSHPGVQADLRAYREVPGGVLAARLRSAVVGDQAAFYDRLYLGGMYSVRGFPTHSLSRPGGDTWLWSGSLEYRSRILGDAKGTKLAGLFFLDAGASGDFDDSSYRGIAAGVGYGLRLRVWWLDWIGVDVGFPLTERPIDERFQATASIGWSF